MHYTKRRGRVIPCSQGSQFMLSVLLVKADRKQGRTLGNEEERKKNLGTSCEFLV